MRTALGLLAAYLIGAVPVGFLVARAFGGLDIRRSGSGNIGATNVLRTLGKLPAIVTLLGDIAKGALAVTAARALVQEPWGDAAGAVLAIVGNCWPVFLGFRGGKGVATGFGAFLALAPWATATGRARLAGRDGELPLRVARVDHGVPLSAARGGHARLSLGVGRAPPWPPP